MPIPSQDKRNEYFSYLRYTQNNLQWKKASKNLRGFIQTQQFSSIRSYRSPDQHRLPSPGRDNSISMVSLGSINLSRKQNERKFHSSIVNFNNSNQKIASKLLERHQKSPQKINQPVKTEQTLKFEQRPINIGVQVSQQVLDLKTKQINNQNKSLKDKVQALEQEVMRYSKKIAQKEDTINNLNSQIQKLKVNSVQQEQNLVEENEKYKKQRELNACMEYIIAELNGKVKGLAQKNLQLEQLLEQEKNKSRQWQKDTSLFIESRSSLSMNSQKQDKFQSNEIFMISGHINEQPHSNILPQGHQNQPSSAVQLSCFNKSPTKIYQAINDENSQINSSTSAQFRQDILADEIVRKHKIEVSKLEEKVKYYEIENLMLRRKKQLLQKSKEEVHQLKERIQKLSEQNKIIKLLQRTNKLKLSHLNQNEKQTKSPLKNQPQLLTFRPMVEPYQQKYHPPKLDQQKEQQRLPIQKPDLKFNVESQISSVRSKQKQMIISSKQLQSPRRKNPMERKFIRKSSRQPWSTVKSDCDSEVSLSLTPQRV